MTNKNSAQILDAYLFPGALVLEQPPLAQSFATHTEVKLRDFLTFAA